MSLSAEAKHIVHCIFCVSFILLFELLSGAVPIWSNSVTQMNSDSIDPIQAYVCV